MKEPLFCLALLWIAIITSLTGCIKTARPPAGAQAAKQSERDAMYDRYREFSSWVKGGSIEPHWMADGSSFWYAEGAPEDTVIYKVDPVANTKTPLFDTERLRQALTPLLGHEPPYQRLPFEEFTFVDDSETAVKFTVEDKEFTLQLDTYSITRAPALSEAEKNRLVPQIVRKGTYGIWRHNVMEVLSPDRRWFAGLKEHNLWLRSTYDGRSVQLTTDGIEDYDWGHLDLWARELPWAWWSPHSRKIAVTKLDVRKVEKIPVVHWLTSPEQVAWVPYPRAGKPLPQTELFIVDIRSKKKILVDMGNEPDQYIHILGWRPDGCELLFHRADRLLKKLDLMAADPNTGTTRVIVTETQKTFVGGWSNLFTLLEHGRRFIWISERDGWNHLYLYGLDGKLLRRLSEGAWPVIRVVAVDEKSGWVYFTAHADQQRPYDTHLYRVRLDGTGFTRLTEATGVHEIEFSPSKQFFIDTHSTVVRPPTVELRRADGTLLQNLSMANIDALISELKWRPPEEFVVKAADGKTDLWGVLYKPYDFDPIRKYPVVEWIYTGRPVVPRTFTRQRGQARAQLGYVTFLVDNRGTRERGKAFEDATYGQRGRVEIADHVVTLKQLAETRPYMDLTRVGIIGHSNGGYAVLRAMLLYPEVYHVGIAAAPGAEPLYQLHDDGELLLGLPQENKTAYEDASNVRLADNLQGKLLLVHGTSDLIAPLSHTLRMADALARAGKSFDMLIMPEQTHSFTHKPTRPYMFEVSRRYFQEHLKP